MKPTEWLKSVDATSLYRESTLLKLRSCSIRYDGGILTSCLQEGTEKSPYSTYGRIASVNLTTVGEERTKGANVAGDDDDVIVYGYEIAAALWRLLRPITVEGPPSDWIKYDLQNKLRRDVASLQRYGY